MKLSELFPLLSTVQREALATKAEIKPAYLWQIATGWRGRRPSISLLMRLADADRRLKVADLVEEFAIRKTTDEAA